MSENNQNGNNLNDIMYCLRCKKKCDVKDVEVKISKNNRRYKQAKCIECECKNNQFLPSVKPPIEKLLDEDKKEDDKKNDVQENIKKNVKRSIKKN